jgi:hypothetical protein
VAFQPRIIRGVVYMSTPSEKNSELVELSDYLARQMREPVSSEPEHPVEAESDLPRSPYAPKSARERAAARLRVLANNDGDPASSPYAPRRARWSEAEPSFGPDGEPVASAREPGYAAAPPPCSFRRCRKRKCAFPVARQCIRRVPPGGQSASREGQTGKSVSNVGARSQRQASRRPRRDQCVRAGSRAQ